MDYRYISADNHLDLMWCPPDLWQSRVPSAMKDQAPKVEMIDGTATGCGRERPGEPRPPQDRMCEMRSARTH